MVVGETRWSERRGGRRDAVVTERRGGDGETRWWWERRGGRRDAVVTERRGGDGEMRWWWERCGGGGRDAVVGETRWSA